MSRIKEDNDDEKDKQEVSHHPPVPKLQQNVPGLSRVTLLRAVAAQPLTRHPVSRPALPSSPPPVWLYHSASCFQSKSGEKKKVLPVRPHYHSNNFDPAMLPLLVDHRTCGSRLKHVRTRAQTTYSFLFSSPDCQYISPIDRTKAFYFHPEKLEHTNTPATSR